MEKSKVLHLNGESEFTKEARQSNLPVLVDFWTSWCTPCIMMAPVLDELSNLMDGRIKVAKVDAEKPENQKLTIEYQIQSIPNMKLFKDGKVIGEFIGLRNLETIKSEIEEIIK